MGCVENSCFTGLRKTGPCEGSELYPLARFNILKMFKVHQSSTNFQSTSWTLRSKSQQPFSFPGKGFHSPPCSAGSPGRCSRQCSSSAGGLLACVEYLLRSGNCAKNAFSSDLCRRLICVRAACSMANFSLSFGNSKGFFKLSRRDHFSGSTCQ